MGPTRLRFTENWTQIQVCIRVHKGSIKAKDNLFSTKTQVQLRPNNADYQNKRDS